VRDGKGQKFCGWECDSFVHCDRYSILERDRGKAVGCIEVEMFANECRGLAIRERISALNPAYETGDKRRARSQVHARCVVEAAAVLPLMREPAFSV